MGAIGSVTGAILSILALYLTLKQMRAEETARLVAGNGEYGSSDYSPRIL